MPGPGRPREGGPFSDPKAGTVVRSSKSGTIRVVVSNHGTDIDYTQDGEPRTILRKSWKEWCSAEKAVLVKEEPDADPTA